MIKGLSIPVIADYKNEDGTVSYENPIVADHAVSYGISWTTSDNNAGYADNGIQENEKGSFQNGELTLGTADLPQDISKRLLGSKIGEEIEFGPTTGKISVQEQIYDDDMSSPYLGFGIIEMHEIDGVIKYRPIWLHKVYFNIPEEAAETKGESVEWQTREITGQIMRSDQADNNLKHPWMTDAWTETESDALEYLLWKGGKTYQS